MLLYNVTVGVDKEIEKEWLLWMKGTHIPNVMKTGMFLDNRIYRVLTHEETESVSYAIQYFAQSLDFVQTYLDKFAPELRGESQKKFGMKAVAYRTLLEEV
jgi:Domain of unknown function (DUF4286)